MMRVGKRRVPRVAVLGLCILLTGGTAFLPAGEPFRLRMTVDFGPDRGQNLGTLFELHDAEGKLVAGAGFLGAYNTSPRAERDQLQFFIRSRPSVAKWSVERLGDIGAPETGFYPFGMRGKLYVYSRGGPDAGVYRWLEEPRRWERAPDVAPATEFIAGKPLEQQGERLLYDGRTLVDGRTTSERIGEHYYAQGKLFVRQFSGEGDARVNRIVVYRWIPEETPPHGLEANDAWTHRLSVPFEFFYTFGQWRDQVVGVTNVGTVLRFDGEQWDVLREPNLKVSYQVYCGINHYDSLLLGHYPTGEFFEFAGGDVMRKSGWPPVMPGVAKSARELQTAAIYDGELYAGVWPWGEVWRYDADGAGWEFVQRMFAHPELTDKVQHPYEEETKRVEKVANLWGQRVTGLLPQGSSLVITTSSKGGQAWEEKYDFLSPERRADYGAVYRATLPGNLATVVDWTRGPTTLEFEIDQGGRLTIRQDGKGLGAIALAEDLLRGFQPSRITWGRGIFGPFAGRIVARETTRAHRSLPARLRSAYVHPDRIFVTPSDAEACREAARKMIEQAESIGLNAIFPYFTGSSGQAYYPSDVAPRSPFGEHDPLRELVATARLRGMKVYPVVCVAVCGNERPAGILLEHPEWGLRHPDGSALGYLSPAHPDARKWIVTIIEEILERAQPDGIVLDYIRFHNRPLRLDAAAEARFERSLPPECSAEERQQSLQAFKEAELTRWVREISQAVRRRLPDGAVGIYCWGPYTVKNHLTAQVWPSWVEQGYVDFVNVSGYYHRDKYGDRYLSLFQQRMEEAAALNQAALRPAALSFALGVSTSHGRIHSAREICDYVEKASQAGIEGFSFFPWHELVPYLETLQTLDCLPRD